jgi:hypothetical protein
MVGQVKVTGILMLINGILLCLMGTYRALEWPLTMAMGGGPGGAGGPGGGMPAGPLLYMFIAYTVLGIVTIACGGINVFAGIRVMSFRNRKLGIVALFLNIPTMLTCCCMLTSIAMMIYGLIVLFNSDVAQGFEMVSQGATPEEVLRQLDVRRGYGDARDDYDDDFGSRRGWEDERRRRRSEDDFDDDDDDRR